MTIRFSVSNGKIIIPSDNVNSSSRYHNCGSQHAFVKEKSLCTNCLSKSHTNYNCSSRKRCLICNKRHKTLLHFPVSTSASRPTTQLRISSEQSSTQSPTSSAACSSSANVNYFHTIKSTNHVFDVL